MNILITGGLGFIGSHLVKFLLEKTENNLIILDNLSTGKKSNIYNLVNKENISRVEIIKESVENVDQIKLKNISKIFHLASHASPTDFRKHSLEIMMTNSFGTKKVLDIALKNNATFILASTSEIYGNPLIHPQNEDYYGNVNTLGIRACYNESKRFSETLSMIYKRDKNLDVRILRIFNTYGTNMRLNDGRVIPTFLKQALTGNPITVRGDGKQSRSLCHVSDLINGIYLISVIKNIKYNVYNIGNPEEIEIIELAEMIKKMTCSCSKIKYIEELDDEPRRRRPDINRIKDETGWSPTISLREGLKKIIPHYKEIL